MAWGRQDQQDNRVRAREGLRQVRKGEESQSLWGAVPPKSAPPELISSLYPKHPHPNTCSVPTTHCPPQTHKLSPHTLSHHTHRAHPSPSLTILP